MTQMGGKPTRPPVRRGEPAYPAACRSAALAANAADGRQRGRGYGPEVVAAARRLYRASELPTESIGRRLGVAGSTVARWARQENWTRPRDMPGPDGRPPCRRRSRP